jgi:nucleotide-binding universal stress UspA family protein
MFKKILVAVDGSSDSERAASAAAELAKAHGSELHVCHVFHIPEHYRADLGEPLRAAIRKDAEDILAHAVRSAERQGIKPAQHLVKEGHPAEAIVNLAQGLQVGLVVVGVRGRTPDQMRTMGSVSEAVARNAKCSVLVVRRWT